MLIFPVIFIYLGVIMSKAMMIIEEEEGDGEDETPNEL